MRQQKVANSYPYRILPVNQQSIKPKLRPIEADEFLLIETLLRTPKMIRLYKRDEKQFQSYLHDRHGILSRDPLGGSHHSLVVPDKQLEEKMLQMGYVDVCLGILDLGIVAKLPPLKMMKHESIVLVGPTDGGSAECGLRLQGKNPRYLHLRLDVSHPPEAIFERLSPLLHDRYKAIKRRSSHTRFDYEAMPRSQILTKLKYFQCYDLQRRNFSIREIADIVYKYQDNADGNTKQALRRAKTMIRFVERTGRLPHKLN